MEKNLFDFIDSEYRRLDYNLGWSLIYGPLQSLYEPKYPVTFFGLNPGGREYHKPQLSNENGSSYLCEDWGSGMGKAPLQIQVQKLFESLARGIGKGLTGTELLSGSMAANLVPFRSPSWKTLHRQDDALKFSMSLWKKRINSVPCKLYITMSTVAFHCVSKLLNEEVGYGLDGGCIKKKTGWGKAQYQIQDFYSPSGKLSLIRLPHLSSYKIFSRDNCLPAIKHIIDHVADIFADWEPR